MSTKKAPRSNRAKVVSMTTDHPLFQSFFAGADVGRSRFVGNNKAWCERHLVFDWVIDPKVASARERLEAFSCSVRPSAMHAWSCLLLQQLASLPRGTK